MYKAIDLLRIIIPTAFLLALLPCSVSGTDIQNVLVRTAPADYDNCVGGGVKTDDASGGYYANSWDVMAILQPGAYASANPWTYVWGTRYAEGWSEGVLRFDNFSCIHGGNYDITFDCRISGMVGASVPRGVDTWGNANAIVTVTIYWRIYDDSDGHSLVYEDDSTFFSGNTTYCTGECDDPIIYDNRIFEVTCPDVALIEGHDYAAEIKMRCYTKGSAYGATDHRAYAAAIFTFVTLNFGPWNIAVDGRFTVADITFADKAPDYTPPVTNIDNPGGIYCQPVTVSGTAEDNSGGYGWAFTKYRLDGGAWNDYTGPLIFEDDVVLEYYSGDLAGNVENIHTESYIFPPELSALSISAEAACDYIDLSWGAVSGADEYCVYRDGSQIECTSETSWRDESPGVDLRCYSIVAKNSCWESNPSAPICRSTIKIPAAPVLANPPSGETDIVQPLTLTWGEAAQATGYKITIADNLAFTNPVLESEIIDNEYEVFGLGNMIKYYWRVAASNQCGWGDWSGIWNFTTACPAAGTVSLLSPEDDIMNPGGAPQPILLDWDDVQDAVKYQVMVCEEEDCNGLAIIDEEINQSGFLCPIMSENQTCYWRVRVYNGCQWGDWSETWGFRTGTTTDITQIPEEIIPSSFNLSQNYPNPFNPETVISFEIPRRSIIKLEIFTVLGERVAVLADDVFGAGVYHATWDGTDYPSGVYFYRLQTETENITRKMILVK